MPKDINNKVKKIRHRDTIILSYHVQETSNIHLPNFSNKIQTFDFFFIIFILSTQSWLLIRCESQRHCHIYLLTYGSAAHSWVLFISCFNELTICFVWISNPLFHPLNYFTIVIITSVTYVFLLYNALTQKRSLRCAFFLIKKLNPKPSSNPDFSSAILYIVFFHVSCLNSL